MFSSQKFTSRARVDVIGNETAMYFVFPSLHVTDRKLIRWVVISAV